MHLEVRRLIEEEAEIATTDPVVMELLAGARDEERVTALRRLLLRFHHLPVESLADFEEAAAIYRACRAGGTTPRSLVDCLTAAVALREKAAVLEQDRDFGAIAAHAELRLHASDGMSRPPTE